MYLPIYTEGDCTFMYFLGGYKEYKCVNKAHLVKHLACLDVFAKLRYEKCDFRPKTPSNSTCISKLFQRNINNEVALLIVTRWTECPGCPRALFKEKKASTARMWDPAPGVCSYDLTFPNGGVELDEKCSTL